MLPVSFKPPLLLWLCSLFFVIPETVQFVVEYVNFVNNAMVLAGFFVYNYTYCVALSTKVFSWFSLVGKLYALQLKHILQNVDTLKRPMIMHVM